jgi:hypothetical protein
MKRILDRRLHLRNNERVRQRESLIVTRILQAKLGSTKGSTLETVRTAERTKVKYERYQYICIYFFCCFSFGVTSNQVLRAQSLFPFGVTSNQVLRAQSLFSFDVTSNQVLRAQSLFFFDVTSDTPSLNLIILMYRSTLFPSVPRRAFDSHSPNEFLTRLHSITYPNYCHITSRRGF